MNNVSAFPMEMLRLEMNVGIFLARVRWCII